MRFLSYTCNGWQSSRSATGSAAVTRHRTPGQEIACPHRVASKRPRAVTTETPSAGREGGPTRRDHPDVEDGCSALAPGKRMGLHFFSPGKCGLWRELERTKKLVSARSLSSPHCSGRHSRARGRKNIPTSAVTCDGCGNLLRCGC